MSCCRPSCLPLPPRCPALLRFRCSSFRRHHRRRLSGMESRRPRTPSSPLTSVDDVFIDGNGPKTHRSASDPDNVVITLDLQDLKHRANALTQGAKQALHGSAVKAVHIGKTLVDDSRMFLDDLRSSVSIQRDRRLVISIRRSSIDFALHALLYTAILLLLWKVWARLSQKYRWGWEENFGSRKVFKRDRSLGGREVVVGKTDSDLFVRKSEKATNRRRINPLDSLELSRSEKEIAKLRAAQNSSSKQNDNSLPEWWPSKSQLLNAASLNGEEVALVKVIMEKRLSGRDFEKDDVLQLRKLCKSSGVRVSFDTTYLRDSFYRSAVNMVLSSCGRYGNSELAVLDEKPVEFLAGLAGSISVEPERAATMVNAAVAARTRACFLQSWALYVQGKVTEAKEEVVQLARIHSIFPPEKDSPEMEMVAQGLARHLAVEERKQLLEIYVKAGGSPTSRIATEALGLNPSRNKS